MALLCQAKRYHYQHHNGYHSFYNLSIYIYIYCIRLHHTHRIHVCYIYDNIYHQYTPFMLAYIPAPWIRHGILHHIAIACPSIYHCHLSVNHALSKIRRQSRVFKAALEMYPSFFHRASPHTWRGLKNGSQIIHFSPYSYGHLPVITGNSMGLYSL